MPILTWDESYSVSVQHMDEEHQKLFDLINQLHDAMKEGKASDVLGSILEGLLDYTNHHFADEEALLAQSNYPGLAGQQAAHASFVSKLNELKSGFASGQLGISMEAMDFMKDWLVTHIQGTDKQYGPYLNQNGVS